MKKFLFILLCSAVSIVACTKTEYITITPEEDTPDTSTYTIMMYGCGGTTLDASMVLNIQEALLEGASDRVNFVGQVKFSARFQDTEALAGTQRFIVGEAGKQWYEPVEVLDTKLELYESENLTDFINWAKAQRPADNYILLLWNHGGAWSPIEDYVEGESRAIIYDDVNDNNSLTLNGLVNGIKDSDTKFKMVYYDACLMGMIEIVSGLAGCTDYTMGASHVTPSIGGDYNSLMRNLKNSTNFEEAIKRYCSETVTHWEPQGFPLDLMVVNNNQMDPLLAEINVLSGYLKEIAQIYATFDAEADANDLNKYYLCTAFNRAINTCYHYDWNYFDDGTAGYPFYDIQNFIEILVNGETHSYSAKLIDLASRINRALSNAIVCKELTSAIERMDLSMGITIVDDYVWKERGYDIAYDELLFQKKTGWGDWLAINPILPTGNPNPATITQLPEQNDGVRLPVEQEIEYLLNLIGKN